MDKTYNGWPSYETWNVMLWMDNEEPAYRAYREKVQHYADKRRPFTAASAKAVVEHCFGDQTPDGVSLNNSRIRWGAIARAMKEN